MPLYEYVCPDCSERFEKFVRSSEATIELYCPTCGSSRPERVFSAFATMGQRTSTTTSSAACGPVG